MNACGHRSQRGCGLDPGGLFLRGACTLARTSFLPTVPQRAREADWELYWKTLMNCGNLSPWQLLEAPADLSNTECRRERGGESGRVDVGAHVARSGKPSTAATPLLPQICLMQFRSNLPEQLVQF